MKLKVLIASICVIALALPVVAQTDWIFSDVHPEHKDVKVITKVKNTGWMKGYDDETFRPDKQITSNQLASVIERAMPNGLTRAETAYALDTMTMLVIYVNRNQDNTYDLRLVLDALGAWDGEIEIADDELCVWYRDGIDGELRPHYHYYNGPREHNSCWTDGISGWFRVKHHNTNGSGVTDTQIEEFYPEFLADGNGNFITYNVVFRCAVYHNVNGVHTLWGFYTPPCSEDREAQLRD